MTFILVNIITQAAVLTLFRLGESPLKKWVTWSKPFISYMYDHQILVISL